MLPKIIPSSLPKLFPHRSQKYSLIAPKNIPSSLPKMENVAVQEERQRNKDKNENEVESTSSNNNDMPIERILDSELRVEPKNLEEIDANVSFYTVP